MGRLYTRYLDHCRCAGVDWMPETRYAGHSLLKDQLVIRLDSRCSARWVKTRYLVGADGSNSRVARQLQLESNREWIVGVEDVLANVPLEGPPRLH